MGAVMRPPVTLQNKILRSFAPLWLIFPSHVLDKSIYSDPPRGPGRCGNRFAQTAAARRAYPQARRRGLYLPAARFARVAQGGANRPRGNGPRRRARNAHARASAAGNLAAKRPLQI